MNRPVAYRRADLRDLYWKDCEDCGETVVMALPAAGSGWGCFETIPDGGAPGEPTYQHHQCSEREAE
jgi:hypothetical protein